MYWNCILPYTSHNKEILHKYYMWGVMFKMTLNKGFSAYKGMVKCFKLLYFTVILLKNRMYCFVMSTEVIPASRYVEQWIISFVIFIIAKQISHPCSPHSTKERKGLACRYATWKIHMDESLIWLVTKFAKWIKPTYIHTHTHTDTPRPIPHPHPHPQLPNDHAARKAREAAHS